MAIPLALYILATSIVLAAVMLAAVLSKGNEMSNADTLNQIAQGFAAAIAKVKDAEAAAVAAATAPLQQQITDLQSQLAAVQVDAQPEADAITGLQGQLDALNQIVEVPQPAA